MSAPANWHGDSETGSGGAGSPPELEVPGPPAGLRRRRTGLGPVLVVLAVLLAAGA